MSGVDVVTLFDGTFSSTSPVTSDFVSISDERDSVTLFVCPTNVNLVYDIQFEDPNGNWHVFDGGLSVNDGDCHAEVIPFNPGRMRIVMTPSAGSGSAIAWSRASGA